MFWKKKTKKELTPEEKEKKKARDILAGLVLLS